MRDGFHTGLPHKKESSSSILRLSATKHLYGFSHQLMIVVTLASYSIMELTLKGPVELAPGHPFSLLA